MSMTKVESGMIEAVDASKLTGTVTNSQIADMDAGKLSGTLPAIDGSNLTGIESGGGGITDADHWRLTADFSGNQTPISSNLARRSGYWGTPLGGGMTQVNGLFSFPATGRWLIQCSNWITAMSNSQGNGIYIRTMTDGVNINGPANWNNMARTGIYKHPGNYPSEGSVFAHLMFNVVDVATHKVDFVFGAGQGTEVCKGHGTYDYTYFTFIKLA